VLERIRQRRVGVERAHVREASSVQARVERIGLPAVRLPDHDELAIAA